MSQCKALNEANSLYAFCPSLGAAGLFAVLYCLTTLFHIFQAVKFRTAFCWVIIMSGTWQTVAYIFRSLSILTPTSQGFYDPQFILILVAPLWTNAFVFMVLGRLVHHFLPDQKLVGIKGRWFGYIFVTMDLICFIVQFIGALSAISKNVNTQKSGLAIYTAGVAFQAFFILVFVGLSLAFLIRTSQMPNIPVRRLSKRMTYILQFVLSLIVLRVTYRIIEYSTGIDSNITIIIGKNEVYQYCFDALPMLTAIVAFNMMHPGTILGRLKDGAPSGKQKEGSRLQNIEPAEDHSALWPLAG